MSIIAAPCASSAEGVANLRMYDEIDKSNEIEMDVNNAYASIIIPPSLSAPSARPVTADRMVIDM